MKDKKKKIVVPEEDNQEVAEAAADTEKTAEAVPAEEPVTAADNVETENTETVSEIDADTETAEVVPAAAGAAAAAVPAKPRKVRRPKSLDKRKAKMGYVFVLPFILGFFIIYLPMIIESLQVSFSEIKPDPNGMGIMYENVGFKNYSYALFEDTEFVKTLITNLKDLLLDVPAIVIFSLFLAIILNQKMHGRAIFRAIFFIPVIVSTGIIEYIDMKNILSETMGSTSFGGDSGQAVQTGTEIINALDVQKFFASMQVGQSLVNYVTGLVNDVYDIVNRSGVQMLIFLAGLQSISPAIYESAYMEGATSWETFWKITFPMISPMILVNAIYTIIDAFTTETNVVMQRIAAVNEASMTHAMAMSWIYFLVVFALIAIVAIIISAYVFYQRRD